MLSDNRPFHFKHFSLLHHQSTMKVGTDSMLLGCWIDVQATNKILDIGTGCGILSLIMAQRTKAQIDAVEIDALSAQEATINFNTSGWKDRLHCYFTDIKQFVDISTKKYDLIISNPPFFVSSLKTKTERRNLARHIENLDFETLIYVVNKLLDSNGRFALVLPPTEGQHFVNLAEKHALFLSAKMEIIPMEGKPVNRLNLVFTKEQQTIVVHEKFSIRNKEGEFTDQHIDLIKDFFLGF